MISILRAPRFLRHPQPPDLEKQVDRGYNIVADERARAKMRGNTVFRLDCHGRTDRAEPVVQFREKI